MCKKVMRKGNNYRLSPVSLVRYSHNHAGTWSGWVSQAPHWIIALNVSWNAQNDLRFKYPPPRKFCALPFPDVGVPTKVRGRRRKRSALCWVDWTLIIDLEEFCKPWVQTNCGRLYAYRHLWKRSILGTQDVYLHPKGVVTERSATGLRWVAWAWDRGSDSLVKGSSNPSTLVSAAG